MRSPAPPAPQGQALPAPCTDAEHEGSRRQAQRFGYQPHSMAGMVELHHKRLLSRTEFKVALEGAPGVLRVVGPRLVGFES